MPLYSLQSSINMSTHITCTDITMAGIISTIDLSRWTNPAATEEELQNIAEDWHSAFHSSGLVYLTNHGLGGSYDRAATEWEYFCSMERKEKEKFSSTVYGASGYNSVGKEAVALSEGDENSSSGSVLADPVESLENGYSDAFDDAFPRSANGYVRGDALRDACLDLYKALDKNVVRPCLAIATKALDMDETADLESSWFAEGSGAYQLRLARYIPRVSVDDHSEVLYGEHTDYDGFTFLWRNKSNGLQALIDKKWHNIPVMEDDPDGLVINLGDLMQFWTQGVWHSPLHRVMKTRNRQDSPSTSDLVSIVFFAGPHADTKLLPLPSPRIPPANNTRDIITAGEHVQQKIDKTAQ